jgi:hypothetical protein
VQSSTSINLIKKKSNILDEIIKWSLSVGRLLIIIVEIVAFSTFLYRFSLDRTLIDLHEKISQQQAIVASLKDREAMYRNLQDRISLASSIGQTGDKNVKILNEIVRLTPSEISFISFTSGNKIVNINTEVKSISALSNFIKSLRSAPEISTASIETINYKNQGIVNVLIKVNLK